jgi:TolA-binding protein
MMQGMMRTAKLLASILVLAASTTTITAAHAEPALDRVLASVQASNQKQCTALNIVFNLRVRYLSHFPVTGGQELRIMLRPIDGQQAANEIISRRESLRAPDTKFGHIRAIDFDAANAAGPALVLLFDQAVNYDVVQGEDFQSIVVKIYGKSGRGTCAVNFPNQNGLGSWSTSVNPAVPQAASTSNAKPAAHGKGGASAEQTKQAETLMDAARKALNAHDFETAAAKFRQLLKLPETEYSTEAQELLGVALQKLKKNDEARANYEDYLARYPSGEGAERVQQRLAGIVTASGDNGQAALNSPSASGSGQDAGAPTWTVSGSASQFYIRDDSFRTLRDPSLPPEVINDLEAHQTHQNELMSSLDATATWSQGGTRSKLRFSGTEDHRFDNKGDEIVGVAALYLDTAVKDWGVDTRIGRQTRNSGGILGRFDGGVFSFEAAKEFRLNLVAGSPVERRRDTPFLDDKYFYGASVDIGTFYGFDTTIFAIEARDRSILDRRAIGTEVRYVDTDMSMFGTVDYDIHFNELNAALINGSYTFADKSTLHGSFDYRKAPYLSAWTALQGQGFPTLYQMLKFKTLAEIDQLAIDRSSSFTTASVGFSKPINDMWQVSADATVSNIGSSKTSGGVTGSPGSGNEFFYSAQVIGNNVTTAEDLLIAGVRFADLDTSRYYVMDFSARYPLMDNLKINPRLMLSYREGTTTDLAEYSILPSVLFDYYITHDWSLELEVGARWTDTQEKGVGETSTDLFFTVGYRYDFYADGSAAAASRAAPYGAGAPK